MTDAELAAAAWLELTKTTDSYPKWKQRGFPANTHWGAAQRYIDQIVGGVLPPPPASATAHFASDWSTGKIGLPWTTIFSQTAPGYVDVGLYGGSPATQSPDGRVAVVPNPFGSGYVVRCELRDGDPPWPGGGTGLRKSEFRTIEDKTWASGAFAMGSEFWAEMELYIPDEFSPASGGSNPFTVIAGLHPSSSTGISALEIGGYPSSYLQLHCGYPDNRINFIPLDTAHRKRKLNVVIGAQVGTSGWVEGWLDGVNVIPRKAMQTAAADESGPYWKQGLYTSADCTYAGGRSFLYHGGTRLYSKRPF